MLLDSHPDAQRGARIFGGTYAADHVRHVFHRPDLKRPATAFKRSELMQFAPARGGIRCFFDGDFRGSFDGPAENRRFSGGNFARLDLKKKVFRRLVVRPLRGNAALTRAGRRDEQPQQAVSDGAPHAYQLCTLATTAQARSALGRPFVRAKLLRQRTQFWVPERTDRVTSADDSNNANLEPQLHPRRVNEAEKHDLHFRLIESPGYESRCRPQSLQLDAGAIGPRLRRP